MADLDKPIKFPISTLPLESTKLVKSNLPYISLNANRQAARSSGGVALLSIHFFNSVAFIV